MAGRYKTIVADPPWPLKWKMSPGVGTRHLDYSTMSITEIAALPIREWADDACNLFLWTTNGYLPEALELVRFWRFEYRMLFTWCKPTGMGAHPRNATEHIVLASRGPILQVLDRGPIVQVLDRRQPQTLNWLQAPTEGHSVKPDVFNDIIERISPGPYLELFARRQRLGWDTWGNEALCHVDNEWHAEGLASDGTPL